MDKRSRVLVGGLPGVGKTTVLTNAAKRISSLSKNALLVVFGTAMFDEAKKVGVKDRDQLRLLPVHTQRELQKKAAEAIFKMDADYVLIDTHFVIRTPEGYWPGMPIEVLRAIRPTHIVMIQAPVGEIVARRASDSARRRDAITAEEIEYELELSRAFMVVAAAETGAPMKLINNPEGKAEEAMSDFLSTIRAL